MVVASSQDLPHPHHPLLCSSLSSRWNTLKPQPRSCSLLFTRLQVSPNTQTDSPNAQVAMAGVTPPHTLWSLQTGVTPQVCECFWLRCTSKALQALVLWPVILFHTSSPCLSEMGTPPMNAQCFSHRDLNFSHLSRRPSFGTLRFAWGSGRWGPGEHTPTRAGSISMPVATGTCGQSWAWSNKVINYGDWLLCDGKDPSSCSPTPATSSGPRDLEPLKRWM